MPREVSEFQLQRALCLWLDGHSRAPAALRPEVVYFHVPNGGARSGIEGQQFKQSGVKPGVPDLLFLDRGHLYGLEMKTATGKPSDAQVTMGMRMVNAGATIAIAYGFEQARRIIIGWNLTVPGILC